MADNFGVLGSTVATVLGTATVYTCPANRAAKCKLFGYGVASGATQLDFLVNNVLVARTAAMAAGNFVYTNKGAGLIAAAGVAPTGQSAAAVTSPSDVIYYLSAGQTVQIVIAGAVLTTSNWQVVGIEVDLTP